MQLLLATHNRGKRREWVALLDGLDVELLLPDDLGLTGDIEETGETYTENALIKARTLAAASGLPTLADDSGLEVDALEGAPGVRSARYHLGTDEVRYRALLTALDGVPEAQRGARFRCIAALVIPGEGDAAREFITEGVCEGVIGFAPCWGRGLWLRSRFLSAGSRLHDGGTACRGEESHQPSRPRRAGDAPDFGAGDWEHSRKLKGRRSKVTGSRKV